MFWLIRTKCVSAPQSIHSVRSEVVPSAIAATTVNDL